MLSFDENGWLYPDPLKNTTHDIGLVEINDLLKLANEEDCWSASIRENVKKRLEKDKTDVSLDWLVEDLMIKDTFNKLGYKAKINTHTTSYIN